LQYRPVVTSFIQVAQRILLLRRSSKVGSYRGRWAGVSGYLEGDENPAQRAMIEIKEEIGLTSEQITLVRAGDVLRVYDERADVVWVVHPFLFEANEPNIRLDWEHIEFQWVRPDELRKYETVPKLRETFDRVRWDLQTVPVALSNITRRIEEVAKDRTHGASHLGSHSIEIMSEVSRLSRARSPDDLFHDLLLVTLRLRNAQPSMATLGNLLGRLLYRIDSRRYVASSTQKFRRLVRSIVDEELSGAKKSVDDASRNCALALPETCRVLSHSYSSTVSNALRFAYQLGKKSEVYATESWPGGEGTRLAKDLASGGLQARLIHDIEAVSDMPNVDLVVVGADSVMADGSVVNKIGTARIAMLSDKCSIPFYVVCETAKFSTFDFLGEPIKIAEPLFDSTPDKYISKIITERGDIQPRNVEQHIRRNLRELYT
jgi:ribose 1,5-bisphosphate isomerase